MHDVEEAARALAPDLEVAQPLVPHRLAAADLARLAGPVRVEDRGQEDAGLVDVDLTAPTGVGDRLREAAVGLRDAGAQERRTEAVTEAAVDHALRRGEDRDRLAPAGHVVELVAHHRGEQATPAMARGDADRGHTGRRDRATAGDGELHRERATGRDDAAATFRASAVVSDGARVGTPGGW